MNMKKIKGLSMVLGALLVLSSQSTIVKSAASASVSKESAVTQANENAILSISRTKAKQIQNALAQYYADNDSYPNEKDFNDVIKAKLGGMPKYEDGSLMIKSYTVTSEDLGRAVEYRIEFNDDKTTVYDESKGVSR
jgi:hypothetical protein